MNGSESLTRKVRVNAGSETELTIQMLPLGVIAGRVLDQYGDPVRHAIVHTEDKLDVPGGGASYESFSTAATDDLGSFRVADVEPGKHYLAVEYSSTHDARFSGIKSRLWPETGGVVIYPDASSIDSAQQVEAIAGQTTQVGDVRLRIGRPVIISGRVSPASSFDKGFSVALQRALPVALSAFPLIAGGVPDRDGSFRMEALPGSYVLTATDTATGKTSKPMTLEVRDRNITDVELELSMGFELRGRISVDGPERLDFARLTLDFGGPLVKIDADGTFHTALAGGKGIYTLQGTPENWYVKDFLVAGRPITARLVDVEPGVSDVSIVLSPGGAQVEVRITGGAGDLGGAVVVLLPDSGPAPDVASILHGEAVAPDKFIIGAVPPGSYRVFALDASNWELMMRPDILVAKHGTEAPLITVSAGQRKTIIIPLSKLTPDR